MKDNHLVTSVTEHLPVLASLGVKGAKEKQQERQEGLFITLCPWEHNGKAPSPNRDDCTMSDTFLHIHSTRRKCVLVVSSSQAQTVKKPSNTILNYFPTLK